MSVLGNRQEGLLPLFLSQFRQNVRDKIRAIAVLCIGPGVNFTNKA